MLWWQNWLRKPWNTTVTTPPHYSSYIRQCHPKILVRIIYRRVIVTGYWKNIKIRTSPRRWKKGGWAKSLCLFFPLGIYHEHSILIYFTTSFPYSNFEAFSDLFHFIYLSPKWISLSESVKKLSRVMCLVYFLIAHYMH